MYTESKHTGDILMVQNLRKHSLNEELDYLLLKSILTDYAQPRAKIRALLKNGTLVRVKKGLYVFGEAFALQPFSKEVLANLMYGPSYISLEYALAYYGMIPERVQTITSITNKRNKHFDTPVGQFSFRYIHPRKYTVGITQISIDASHNIIIASPEKALADKISLTPGLQLESVDDVEAFLTEDLRIDLEILKTVEYKNLKRIAAVYKNKNLNKVLGFIQEITHA